MKEMSLVLEDVAKDLKSEKPVISEPVLDSMTERYLAFLEAALWMLKGSSYLWEDKKDGKAMYKDSADTILGNCDTTLFLGGKEKTTLKEMSELLGKETIDLYNTSETRSNQKSFGLNYQKTGKQLMTEDEIAVMDGGKCILQIRGARPFFSDKYDITKHKNYRLLADENEKNRYKVEKELNPQYTPKPEEAVEVIQVDLSE